MTFEHPAWLSMTPVILLIIAGLIVLGLRQREALLSQFAASRLLNQLTKQASLRRILLKSGLILFSFALICIALARPQYGVDIVERKARGLDIVFVIDSSKSMLATDLKPSRLERAKLAIIDLVQRLESDRIGLVVFSGNAFLQTPPTLDYSAFQENLNAVSTESISRGGSHIGRALEEAVKAFPQDNNFKVVILLTDGEDLEAQAVETAKRVAKDSIRIYAIGIGTPEGTYLKTRTYDGREEFIRDYSGQPVRSRLDETTLRTIAQRTGGSYSRLDGQSLSTLYNSVLATLPRQERNSDFQETHIERYQWLLAAAIALLILESLIHRRKRANIQLTAAIFFLNILSPSPSNAEEKSLQPVALQIEQSGETAVDANDTKLLSNPRALYNAAHQDLMAGDYEKAKNRYQQTIEHSDDKQLERDALYNMAHAVNQLGESALLKQDFEAAIEHWKQAEALFKSANEIDPVDILSLQDAQQLELRRKALESFLQQQEQQEQQEQGDSQQNDQSKQNDQDSKTDSTQDGQSDETQTNDAQNNSESSNDQESSEQSSSKIEDSQSNPNSSEQSQSYNQEDDSKENASNETEDTSGQNKEDKKDSAEANKPDQVNNKDSAESSRNPAEDMHEQEQNAEDSASSMSKDSEETPESEAAGSKAEQGQTAQIKEMKLSEAQALLDSLQESERLLPFVETYSEPGKKKEKRDW